MFSEFKASSVSVWGLPLRNAGNLKKGCISHIGEPSREFDSWDTGNFVVRLEKWVVAPSQFFFKRFPLYKTFWLATGSQLTTHNWLNRGIQPTHDQCKRSRRVRSRYSCIHLFPHRRRRFGMEFCIELLKYCCSYLYENAELKISKDIGNFTGGWKWWILFKCYCWLIGKLVNSPCSLLTDVVCLNIICLSIHLQI